LFFCPYFYHWLFYSTKDIKKVPFLHSL